MPTYSDDEPPRSRRSRRSEYYEPDSDTEDRLNHPPPKPRARQSRPSKREEKSAPPKRRPSILKDPDESARQRDSRRPRSHSNVRLQTPGSDSESATQDPRRRPRGPPKPRKSRFDLESKDGPKYRQFREKRNGYESEEGEMLRNANRSSRPREPDFDDMDGYDRRGKPNRRPRDDPDRNLRPDRDPRVDRESRPDKDPRSGREPSRREKPRDAAESAAGAAASAAAGPAFAENAHTKTRRTYKDDPRSRQGYADDDDDNDEPPRRRPSRHEGAGRDDCGDPRRSTPEMSGYRSDAPPPRRRERGRDDEDYDIYDRKRRDDAGYRSSGGRDVRPPRPSDYYSDYRDDRARRTDVRDKRTKNPARESYREDDRYRDYDKRRGEDDRGRSSKPKKAGGLAGLAGLSNLGKFDFKDSAWQKEATAAFMTYALPVIKKEGTKYAKREMQKYMEKQAGGRRR